MSEPLTMNRVLARLQMVLMDLTELAHQAGQPFQGISINGLNFSYRDQGTTFWKVKILPEGMPDEDDNEVEEIPMDEYLGDEEPDDEDPIVEAFVQGVDEARQ